MPRSTVAPPVPQLCPAIPGGRVAAGRPVGARSWYLALGTGFTAATTSLDPCEAQRSSWSVPVTPPARTGDTGVATSLPQLMAPWLLRAAPSGSAWLPHGGPASSQRACCQDSIRHHLNPGISSAPACPEPDTAECTPSFPTAQHQDQQCSPRQEKPEAWLGARGVPVGLGAARGWLALPDDVADVVRGPWEML